MNYDLNFKGKRAIVVGGTSGIGNATAQAFRFLGAAVQVWGTRKTAEDYRGAGDSDLDGLEFRSVDVSDPKQIQAVDVGVEHLDVLVLSQGIALYERAEFQPDRFRHVVDVNLNSVMDCCLRFHAMLKESAGTIVIISSTAALHSTRGNPAYAASKTGVLGLARTLGDAWAPDGIRVNCVAPGMIPTKMTKVTTENPRRVQMWEQMIPLGRLGSASEIASVVVFLASPLASYMIGQTIAVDGGLTLR